MGCTGSKVQNEEGVARCRKRKRAVKLALRFRNQYALAHSDYILCLRNLSSAFKHFSVGEFREQLSSSSSAGSSSSASSTPLPATPTTPLKSHAFPDVVISSIKIPPKHLRSNPPAPITVVVSPPKSPEHRPRGSVFSRDEDEYERYMAADAPPAGLYDDIQQPGKPRGTAGGTPASSGWFSFWNYGGGGGGGEASSSSPSYPEPKSGSNWYDSQEQESDSSWDIFGIFQVPQMMYGHQRFEEPIEEENEEEMKRELEEEQVPALEAESPKREKLKTIPEEIHLRHVEASEEEDDSDREMKKKQKKKKKVDDEPVLVHEEPEISTHTHTHTPAHTHSPTHAHTHTKSHSKPEPAPEPEPERVPEIRLEEVRIPDSPPRKLKGVIIEEIEEEEEEEVPVLVRKPARGKAVSSSGMKHEHSERSFEHSDRRSDEELRFEDVKMKAAEPPRFSPRAAEPRFSPRAVHDPPPPPAASVKEMEIWDALHVVYEQFESVSTMGSDVARLLEPRKTHHGYTLGLSDRIFRVVSRSPRTPLSSSLSEDSSSDDFGGSSKFTPGCHATTLDKLYAWEKKLYSEVKDNESISAEFHRKCKQLKKLDARGASSEIIDKTRVAIKVLENQMQVSMEAMKATSRNIQELTDKDLFHQLLELLQASMIMWENMYFCHQKQRSATERIKSPASSPLEATSNSHKLATQQLEAALNEWHRALDKLVKRQKEYLRNMNTWLRLSVYTPERKNEVRVRPPVHSICQAWASAVERVAEQKLLEAIKSFSEVIHNVVRLQEEEERSRRKSESLAKELSKKALSLNLAEKKLVGEGSGSEEAKASLEEKKAALEAFRKRVEDEKENFSRAILVTRKGTVGVLEEELPKLFRCLEEFSSSCLVSFREVHHKARNNEFDGD